MSELYAAAQTYRLYRVKQNADHLECERLVVSLRQRHHSTHGKVELLLQVVKADRRCEDKRGRPDILTIDFVPVLSFCLSLGRSWELKVQLLIVKNVEEVEVFS